MPRQDDFENQLEVALAHRPVIEQAKGALPALRGALPRMEAFAELRWASMTHNIKLHALAEALMAAVSGRAAAEPRSRATVEREWGGCCPRLVRHRVRHRVWHEGRRDVRLDAGGRGTPESA